MNKKWYLLAGLLIVLVVAPLLSLLLIQLAGPVFPFLNKDESVIEQGVPYLQLRLAAIVFVGMNFAFRGYWNALDLSRLYMMTLIIMHACNIFLNYVLIFGHFGAPAMGVTGAGLASAMSMFYAQSAAACHYMFHAEDGKYRDRLLGYVESYYRGKVDELDVAKVFGIEPEVLGRGIIDYAELHR